jgi:[ribosomal protein S18]-alanine N-acetyltransferase
MITVTQGDAHDVASIMPVMQNAFDPAFGEAWSAAQCLSLLAIPNTALYLARSVDAVIGFAMTRWVLDEEELLMIGVVDSKQRMNIGSSLLNHMIYHAAYNGRSKVFLEVRDGNVAEYFYKAKGFTETGRRKGYYKGQNGLIYDAITMTRLFHTV